MINRHSDKASFFRRYKFSDIVLVIGILIIMALMVLRLPTAIIDALVGVNIAMGIGLLLIAIYIPTPVAFNSFPSVLLISTLFRLALSVATTRLILLDANAGEIINAFGNFVAGGNLVVGIVVFIIITVVQFIVIAKGAERVAEVAARFTLDAMPGKQMSIDSDLRSGLIDKDEAKRRRELLAKESQLNGALDGAMKFVKGDAIASIIIVFVNLIGGLTIGVLQNEYSAAQAMQIYSILTIGDGMVAQIPALLGAMAAGLFVTRTAGENADKNLGETIAFQLFAQPRALMMTGFIALILAIVPGFPSVVFLTLSLILLSLSYYISPTLFSGFLGSKSQADEFIEGQMVDEHDRSVTVSPLRIELGENVGTMVASEVSFSRIIKICNRFSEQMGIVVPQPVFSISSALSHDAYRIVLFDVSVANEKFPVLSSVNVNARQIDTFNDEFSSELEKRFELVLRKNAAQFLGVQEVSDMMEQVAKQYPALAKEVFRMVSLQDLLEILRNLLNESIPVRNMRDILGTILEWGEKEKDPYSLTEFVRMGLKRYMTQRYTDAEHNIRAWLVDPQLEQTIRQSITPTPAGNLINLEPSVINQLQFNLKQLITEHLSELSADKQEHTVYEDEIKRLVILSSVDVRRYVKKIFENAFPELPVLSYQELMMPVNVINLGQLTLQSTLQEVIENEDE